METNRNLLNQSGCLRRETLLAWLENRLSPAEKTIVENHLQECILCREAIEGFESSYAARVRAAFADINTSMQQRLLLHEKKGLSRRMKLSLAAAVLLLLIGVFSVFKFRPVEKPMEIAQEIHQPKLEQQAPASAPVIVEKVKDKAAEKSPALAKPLAKEKITGEDRITKNEVEIPAQEAETVTETLAAGPMEQKEEKPAEEPEAIAYNAPAAEKRRSEPVSARSMRYAEKSVAVEYKDKTESTYYVVQEPARFQGGDISKFKTYVESKFAEAGKEAGFNVSGILTVSFIVDKDGKMRDVFVVKGLDAKTDSIVKSIVESSPVWQPGRQQGKAVNVNMVVEVKVSGK